MDYKMTIPLTLLDQHYLQLGDSVFVLQDVIIPQGQAGRFRRLIRLHIKYHCFIRLSLIFEHSSSLLLLT